MTPMARRSPRPWLDGKAGAARWIHGSLPFIWWRWHPPLVLATDPPSSNAGSGFPEADLPSPFLFHPGAASSSSGSAPSSAAAVDPALAWWIPTVRALQRVPGGRPGFPGDGSGSGGSRHAGAAAQPQRATTNPGPDPGPVWALGFFLFFCFLI
jgi:hypothetical protein